MTETTKADRLTPEDIRAARAQSPNLRDRELAASLGLSEAQLLASDMGNGVTRIAAHPDRIIPQLTGLGQVMALTRNDSCVIEKDGIFDKYHSGEHAAMVLTPELDMRFFPSHWVHAMAVEREVKDGVRRSIQVFDAAGTAVHKVFLRDGSNLDHWQKIVADLATGQADSWIDCEPRTPPSPPKSNPAKVEELRAEWLRMTDTHQFMRLTSKLRMNRLGAYHIAGAPHVRQLDPACITPALEAIRDAGIEVMIFVGNHGCIEIHGGPIHTLKEMGPFQNVLDPGFNLHLMHGKVVELWAVNKPTKRGPAISVEGFDAEGGIVFQIFGRKSDAQDWRPDWWKIVDALPDMAPAEVA
ncbi:hemin-degrading factor [Chachezhania antarctica]|uniref:hemin-degrading factor n=1 Tax=Chachezhania antarctica TaxID=2340860 RepID=UPI000EB05197|nr:ChuX/HutX family heme-like substrate-binding protein [Chachezhania antarctica]|tara:strand:- start:2641 stop:3705 length:1065 start_codon:yes stop_codon:yes gene_type:complete